MNEDTETSSRVDNDKAIDTQSSKWCPVIGAPVIIIAIVTCFYHVCYHRMMRSLCVPAQHNAYCTCRPFLLPFDRLPNFFWASFSFSIALDVVVDII